MTRTSLRSFLTITTFASAVFATLLVCAAIAHADYTVSSCGGYPNEGVFSALLPPGGSVITSGSVCPSSGQGFGAAKQQLSQQQPGQTGRMVGQRARGARDCCCVGRATRYHRLQHEHQRQSMGRRGLLGRRHSGHPNGVRRRRFVVWICLPVLRLPTRLRRQHVRRGPRRRATDQRDGQFLGSRDPEPVKSDETAGR